MYVVILRCAMDDLPLLVTDDGSRAVDVAEDAFNNPQLYISGHPFSVDASMLCAVEVWRVLENGHLNGTTWRREFQGAEA
jgi:hypothetical protein